MQLNPNHDFNWGDEHLDDYHIIITPQIQEQKSLKA
jgi:hypothetical protein